MAVTFNPFTGTFDIVGSSSGGTGTAWYTGVPTESPDSLRTTFTVPAAYVPGGLVVFLNGLRESHFTEATSTTFTMSEAPLAGDELMLMYRTS